MASIQIDVANEQACLTVDPPRLQSAVQAVLSDAGVRRAEVSLAVVDNQAIHELNRRFLQHDFPTDALSFVLEQTAESLVGQIIVSAEMARSVAAEDGASPHDELLLYVIHATLHLVGYDDLTAEASVEMRRLEKHYLAQFGAKVRSVEGSTFP